MLRALDRMAWALALTPLAWLALFAAFVLRARVALGAWPAPYRPDPKDLGFDVHYYALLLGLPLLIVAMLGAVAFAIYLRKLWVAIAAAASIAGLILLARLDPGNLFVWLGD